MGTLNQVRALLCAAAVLVGMSGPSAAQTPPPPPDASQPRTVATIDFYGLRSLDADAVRKFLPVHEGDRLTQTETAAVRKMLEAQLSKLPHVQAVQIGFVCCDPQGGWQMFIGVQEDGAPTLKFRPAPTGALRMPEELVAVSAALDRATYQAVSQGKAQEDDSQGHALLTNYPEGRALQEQFASLAGRNLPLLQQVLRESADGRQRAMAARYLGYAPDKQAVVDDLVYAVDDPYGEVRNDAVRALLVMSHAANNRPRIPYEPFIDLLQSPVWTDLNKSSFALASLTESRDPKLLALLRARSLGPLSDMARWRDHGHGYPGLLILGRIAGYAEPEIGKLWAANDVEAVIRRAVASGGAEGHGSAP